MTLPSLSSRFYRPNNIGWVAPILLSCTGTNLPFTCQPSNWQSRGGAVMSVSINKNVVLLQRLSVLSVTQLHLYAASQSFSWTGNSLRSIRHEGSLPRSQQPTTDTSSQPDEPVCVVTLCFHSDHNTLLFTIYSKIFHVISFLNAERPFFFHLFRLSWVLYALEYSL